MTSSRLNALSDMVIKNDKLFRLTLTRLGQVTRNIAF